MPGPKGTYESVFGADETGKDKEKKVTPVVEVVPSAPKKSEYEFNTQFVKDLYGEDLESVDEKNKRKRAATAINAIGHLGNALSAVNNMVWSGQHAPSQTLPTINNNMVQAYEDKYGARRKDYLNAIHAGRAADLQEFNQAYSRFNADRQHQLEKDKMAFGKEQFEYTKEKDKKDWGLKEKANQIAETNANANMKRANAYVAGRKDEDGNPITGRRNTKQELTHVMVYNPTSKTNVPMRIDRTKYDDPIALRQLYNKVGGKDIVIQQGKNGEVLMINKKTGGVEDVNTAKYIMQNYIADQMESNPSIYDHLIKSGIGQPIPVSREK